MTTATATATVEPSPRLPIRLYPIAFPLAFLVMAWTAANVHVSVLLRPAIVTVLVGLAVIALATWLAGDRDTGAILASVILLALMATDGRLAVILAALAVLVAGLVLWDRRRPGRGERIVRIAAKVMRGVAIVLVLAISIKLIGDGVPAHVASDISADLTDRPVVAVTGDPPDIVILMLDAFPGDRGGAMAGAASQDFSAALRSRGFEVQRDSHANYLFTGLTLGSMFGMAHIADQPTLGAPWDEGDGDARRLRLAINDGAAFDLLANAGYELTAVSSGFDHVEVRNVDQVVAPWGPSEFEVAFLRLIAAGDLVDVLAPDLLSSMQRQRILDAFAATERLAIEPHDRPRLVFGHVPAPHAPWVFGRDGEPRQARLTTFYSDDPRDLGVDRDEAFARADAQAAYVGGLALQTVDAVLASQTRPAIVVVMSDHGTGVGLNPEDAGDSDLAERFSNLMAIRTPNGADLIGDRLTPVNLFPRIAKAYLGIDVPESDNGLYAWDGSYLDTVEVTPVPAWAP